MTRQRQALGLLWRHQQRDDLHDFRLVFLLLDFLRHREHFDVLQNHLRNALSPAPSLWVATSTSTLVCGSTKPATSLTSSTGTDTARIPNGISSGITPAVLSPVNSLACTIGSLATKEFFT